jgi:hypothetical protein
MRIIDKKIRMYQKAVKAGLSHEVINASKNFGAFTTS